MQSSEVDCNANHAGNSRQITNLRKSILKRAKQVRGGRNMDFRPSKMDCISVTLDAVNLTVKWNCVEI